MQTVLLILLIAVLLMLTIVTLTVSGIARKVRLLSVDVDDIRLVQGDHFEGLSEMLGILNTNVTEQATDLKVRTQELANQHTELGTKIDNIECDDD